MRFKRSRSFVFYAEVIVKIHLSKVLNCRIRLVLERLVINKSDNNIVYVRIGSVLIEFVIRKNIGCLLDSKRCRYAFNCFKVLLVYFAVFKACRNYIHTCVYTAVICFACCKCAVVSRVSRSITDCNFSVCRKLNRNSSVSILGHRNVYGSSVRIVKNRSYIYFLSSRRIVAVVNNSLVVKRNVKVVFSLYNTVRYCLQTAVVKQITRRSAACKFIAIRSVFAYIRCISKVCSAVGVTQIAFGKDSDCYVGVVSLAVSFQNIVRLSYYSVSRCSIGNCVKYKVAVNDFGRTLYFTPRSVVVLFFKRITNLIDYNFSYIELCGKFFRQIVVAVIFNPTELRSYRIRTCKHCADIRFFVAAGCKVGVNNCKYASVGKNNVAVFVNRSAA